MKANQTQSGLSITDGQWLPRMASRGESTRGRDEPHAMARPPPSTPRIRQIRAHSVRNRKNFFSFKSSSVARLSLFATCSRIVSSDTPHPRDRHTGTAGPAGSSIPAPIPSTPGPIRIFMDDPSTLRYRRCHHLVTTARETLTENSGSWLASLEGRTGVLPR